MLHCKARGDIREASGFVITTEPLGFVLTKQVNDFLLRVHGPQIAMLLFAELGKAVTDRQMDATNSIISLLL